MAYLNPGQEKQIGDYIIQKELNNREFSQIYIGKHIPTGEKVTIEIIKFEDANNQQVETEKSLLKILMHKNIIKLYEIIETEHRIYLIMEYCDGEDLSNYIQTKNNLKENYICKIFHQIIDAIEYLHQLNICHINMTPDNILLNTYTTFSIISIKLTDFTMSNINQTNNIPSQNIKKSIFEPPEIFKNEKYNGKIRDIWNIGIILYYIVFRNLPFSNENQKIIDDDYNNGKFEIPIKVSDELIDLLKHLIDINPETRYNLEQIKNHPWYNLINEKKIPGVIFGKNEIPIDERILEYCQQEYGYNKEQIRESIKNNYYDSNCGIYYINLQKAKMKNITSVADLYSEEYQEFINEQNNLIDKNKINNGNEDNIIIKENKKNNSQFNDINKNENFKDDRNIPSPQFSQPLIKNIKKIKINSPNPKKKVYLNQLNSTSYIKNEKEYNNKYKQIIYPNNSENHSFLMNHNNKTSLKKKSKKPIVKIEKYPKKKIPPNKKLTEPLSNKSSLNTTNKKISNYSSRYISPSKSNMINQKMNYEFPPLSFTSRTKIEQDLTKYGDYIKKLRNRMHKYIKLNNSFQNYRSKSPGTNNLIPKIIKKNNYITPSKLKLNTKKKHGIRCESMKMSKTNISNENLNKKKEKILLKRLINSMQNTNMTNSYCTSRRILRTNKSNLNITAEIKPKFYKGVVDINNLLIAKNAKDILKEIENFLKVNHIHYEKLKDNKCRYLCDKNESFFDIEIFNIYKKNIGKENEEDNLKLYYLAFVSKSRHKNYIQSFQKLIYFLLKKKFDTAKYLSI